MRMSKVLMLVSALIFVCNVSAFAGAPAPTTEKPIPVEQYTPPAAPAAPTVSPLVISKHFTWGIGLGGNPIIGYVEKDQYGYPRTEYTGPFYGIDWVLGFGETWFSGQPTPDQISAAVIKIKTDNPGISDKDLGSAVRKELGNRLTYVGLGTALLVVPVNAEIGLQWVLSDNMRTRLGIGIPTLLCFGVNWDL